MISVHLYAIIVMSSSLGEQCSTCLFYEMYKIL